MLEICLFGAGRIGAIHAANAAAHPAVKLRVVCDVNPDAASKLAARFGARAVKDPDEALREPGVNAVIIASSTPTHVDLITRSARAGKAIFCEKPIDLDLARVDACVAELEKSKVPFLIGFNRRFDPSFAALHTALRKGEIGKLESVIITSRDPRPPPAEYVKVSGGIFRDMMIHDLDMARWLLGEEPVTIHAEGSCLVDPAIGAAGDVDTAMVVMKTASGVLCTISNSRRASYGYDQRIEVFGEKGMLQAQNRVENTVSKWSSEGVVAAKPLDFFLERYAEAYRAEMETFVASVERGVAIEPGARDGRQALVLADAALASLRSGRPAEVAR